MPERWPPEARRDPVAGAAARATRAAFVAGALLVALALAPTACTSKPRRQPRVDDAGAASAASADSAAPAASSPGPRITSLSPPPRQPAGAVPPALVEPAIALPLRESFTVEDAGEAPRRKLRYALEAGARRYTVAAKLTARSFTGTAAQPTAMPIPPFRERFTVQVERRPGGAGQRERWSWRGEPIAIDGDATAAAPYVLRWRQLLANRNATFILDDQAFPRDITFAEDPLREHSGPEREELTQRLLGQLVPLPLAPVGKGARWTAVTVLRQGFAVVKQTASYHLVAAEGDRLTLAIDLRRVAEEQLVELPDAPPGAQVELVALFRATTGTVTLELGAALPVSGELTVEARSHQRLTAANGQVSELITEDLGALALSSEPL